MKMLFLSLLLLVGAYYGLGHRADLAQYQAYFEDVDGSLKDAALVASYFGTSTIAISDGNTTIMSDGFFTRPGMGTMLFGRFQPDAALIAQRLADAGIKNIAAVVPIHSHHDHAMDSAEVARQTGAVVLGSRSTAYIAEGWGLSPAQITVAEPGGAYRFGDFTVTLIESEHAAAPALVRAVSGGGEVITEPVRFPARLSAYREGGSYSVHIAHPSGNTLIHGSAGFVEGALAGYQADTVFLGVSGLGRMSADQRQAYFDAVVAAVGAKHIVPIHWDDFTETASERQALQRMPWYADDFDEAMGFLLATSEKRKLEISLMSYGGQVSLSR